MLKIRCRKHRNYMAEKPTKKCASCSLLYVLRWQYSKEPDERLGGINPYQFLGDLQEACEGLEVKP